MLFFHGRLPQKERFFGGSAAALVAVRSYVANYSISPVVGVDVGAHYSRGRRNVVS